MCIGHWDVVDTRSKKDTTRFIVRPKDIFIVSIRLWHENPRIALHRTLQRVAICARADSVDVVGAK